MSEITFKFLATEIGCNTVANNFSSNGLIRVTNIDTIAHTCTLAFANALTYATFTVPAGTVLYVQKGYTDLLSSNATSLCLGVAVKRGSI